jgi:hypothetical protein
MAYGLRQVVQQIRDRVAGCSYVVPAPPPPFVMVDATTVDFIYMQGGTTEVRLTKAPQDDCAMGGDWYFSAYDQTTGLPTRFDLCADLCTIVQSDLDASLETLWLCLEGG